MTGTRNRRWPDLFATGLVLIAVAIVWLAYTAFATNVTVSASAKCVDSDTGRYDVTASAHNTYSQTLHVTVINPNSPILLTLVPDQTWTFTFHVDHYQPWTVKFTTSDGILVGQTLYNFTFEGVCGAPPPPPSTTSSTTCDRANPPRSDCGTTTTTTVQPPSSTAVTPPPASDTVTSTSPPTSVTASTAGAAGHPTTVVHALPVTGSGDAVAFLLAGLACLIAGGVLYTVKRRPS